MLVPQREHWPCPCTQTIASGALHHGQSWGLVIGHSSLVIRGGIDVDRIAPRFSQYIMQFREGTWSHATEEAISLARMTDDQG